MKVDKLSKSDLCVYCKTIDISVFGKNKSDLVKAVYDYESEEIKEAIRAGTACSLLSKKINHLADDYANNLNSKIIARKEEMKRDNTSHYLIYRVLGISIIEGKLIDEYQNTGRFLYKYAGSFLEESASICMHFANSAGGKTRVVNTEGSKPKTFEIDFLNGDEAVELKWRDATTDGDHITKEHTRIKVISNHGYKPIRVMFYYPQRTQAIRIQKTLKTLYNGIGGEYYAGDDAWDYLKKLTGTI